MLASCPMIAALGLAIVPPGFVTDSRNVIVRQSLEVIRALQALII